MTRRDALMVAATAGAMACGRHPESETAVPGTDPASVAFRAFVEDYFHQYFNFNPASGTEAGFHQYDGQMADYSAAAFRNRTTELKSLQSRLVGIRKQKISSSDAIDASILDGRIQSELLDLDTLQTWRTNPMAYIYAPGSAVDSLIKRNFAPAPDRLRSAILRLRRVPEIVSALRENVAAPPREFTDVAVRMASGSVLFFRQTVPAWAREAAGNDRRLLRDFELALEPAARAMESAAAYLKDDLLPRSNGQFAIGSTAYRQKLQYDEHIDTPLHRLLEIGEANLEKDYRDFVETARRIDPKAKPQQVMDSMAANHPSAAQLIPVTREMLEGLRQFILDRKILQFPSAAAPRVIETPVYSRSGYFAAMDTPGAFEKKAREAYYHITPPEKDWSPRHTEEHLRAFGRPVLDIISVHEAFPGHFTQFLFARHFPSKTRKLVYCGTNVEGWAHYAEQMMIEEGLGTGDPKFKLAQLAEALVRDARYVAGIKLHTRGMTVAEAAKLFEAKAFQTPANAYEEARRGAYDPTYLVYTLGKLQIYKLREDYRRARGNRYSLEQFHTDFIREGGIPLKILRGILLPGDPASSI